jgi:hypothetical protein
MSGDQAWGFCRLAVAHELMAPPYDVIVNNASVLYATAYENETLSVIYFSYDHSTLEIAVIPEFKSLVLTTLLVMATMLAGTHSLRQKTCHAHPNMIPQPAGRSS